MHCADRDANSLHGTAEPVRDRGGTAHLPVLDVTDRARPGEAVRSRGRLDVPAAVVGPMHSSPVVRTRDEDLDRVLNIIFKGLLYTCQEATR